MKLIFAFKNKSAGNLCVLVTWWRLLFLPLRREVSQNIEAKRQ